MSNGIMCVAKQFGHTVAAHYPAKHVMIGTRVLCGLLAVEAALRTFKDYFDGSINDHTKNIHIPITILSGLCCARIVPYSSEIGALAFAIFAATRKPYNLGYQNNNLGYYIEYLVGKTLQSPLKAIQSIALSAIQESFKNPIWLAVTSIAALSLYYKFK